MERGGESALGDSIVVIFICSTRLQSPQRMRIKSPLILGNWWPQSDKANKIEKHCGKEGNPY